MAGEKETRAGQSSGRFVLRPNGKPHLGIPGLHYGVCI
jgi:hypothetical protein